MQNIGFDVISDLNLDPQDSFNWEGKATSLYCLVAGNVSTDIRTVVQTLAHLSRFYQGVFYVPGTLEYQTCHGDVNRRTDELIAVVEQLSNVVMLHQHVVIIDGIAIVGANGWGSYNETGTMLDLIYNAVRLDDIAYLHKSVGKLQKHLDVRKIVIVSNAVPDEHLYFGEAPEYASRQIPLHTVLTNDTEHKISHWVFGTYDKSADTHIGDVNYINNPYMKKNPYWAKRITLTV